jgi:hypothetical protein
VHSPDEPGAERERLEPPQPELHGPDVAHDLLNVGAEGLVSRLRVKDLEQGSLSALDPRGGHRLPPQIRLHQEVGVGKEAAGPGQPIR